MVGIYRNPKVTIRLKASAGNIEQYGSGIAGWNRPGTGRQDGCAELDCGDGRGCIHCALILDWDR